MTEQIRSLVVKTATRFEGILAGAQSSATHEDLLMRVAHAGLPMCLARATGYVLQTNPSTAEQLSSIALDASTLAWEYLCTPNGWLSKFEGSHATVPMQQWLRSSPAYPFLGELLLAWIEVSGAPAMRGISHRSTDICRSIFSRMSAVEFVAQLEPIYELSQFESGIPTIPRSAACSLLADIGLVAAATRLAGVQGFTRTELAQELTRLMMTMPSTNPVLAQQPSGAPLHEELRRAGVPVPPVASGHRMQDAGAVVGRPREIKSGAMNVSGLPPVEAYIPFEERAKFVRKLFEGNEAHYQKALALINQAQDWKQASVYVEAVFLKHKIDPFSKRAIKFTDAVYNRFNRRTQQETA